jgi:hypothetical protein
MSLTITTSSGLTKCSFISFNQIDKILNKEGLYQTENYNMKCYSIKAVIKVDILSI